ncbi:MAG: hypothetical protein IPL52_06470 [Flavobacteriales bacterium]|nr:hypothetical protein [Flavobacteriales bacterium]
MERHHADVIANACAMPKGHIPQRMMPRNPMNRLKEGFKRRRAAINELHFTYKGLMRLLPAIARRVEPEPLGEELAAEHAEDARNLQHLNDASVEHGLPPGACVCEEAAELVENVYHADRVGRTTPGRTLGIVLALKSVRMYLILSWGRLLSALHGDVPPTLQNEAADIQRREAKQHRDLVILAEQLEHGEVSDEAHKA